MYDMDSNDHDLDPLQKGCRNFLYVAFAVMLIPISALGAFWLFAKFILRPETQTMPGAWPLYQVVCIAGAMIVLPLMFFSWIKDKLFYRNQ